MRSDRNISFGALLASAIALTAFAVSGPAQTYDFRVLHVFTGADGQYPDSAVQFDAAGDLYGSVSAGGVNGDGLIFKIAKDGTETAVHYFDGFNDAADGYLSQGPVTIDLATGDLYGTTNYGGDLSACAGLGCGVLYKQAADGTYTVLHRFDGVHDGALPYTHLLRDLQGNLYGTTSMGGTNDDGTLYRYGADGSFTVLHTFAGSDGSSPRSGVIENDAGSFFGSTGEGGANGQGTIYELKPDGAFTTLYSFTGGTDGAYPNGLVGDKAGNLYGSTYAGGYISQGFGSGTVFRLAPDGTFTTLYRFTGRADGRYPVGDLLRIGGNLYGTTSMGGNVLCTHDQQLNCGVIFKLAPDGTETVLHTFKPGDRSGFPSAGLTLKYGRLFGTAEHGGSGQDGTVFSVGVATQ